ncbi:MAG TPA: type II toxin-antitoxin system HicB family antitoxin [Candidatus Atribacteria bacterium]|nr:type II toxin-antitoxin system HicB family antitoxin [Candidatus Atribacteria bacterium]
MLAAIYKKTDNWWIGFVEEIPRVNTQGKTIEEARKNLKEALELIIQSNRELAEKEIETKKSIKEELTITI